MVGSHHALQIACAPVQNDLDLSSVVILAPMGSAVHAGIATDLKRHFPNMMNVRQQHEYHFNSLSHLCRYTLFKLLTKITSYSRPGTKYLPLCLAYILSYENPICFTFIRLRPYKGYIPLLIKPESNIIKKITRIKLHHAGLECSDWSFKNFPPISALQTSEA